MEIVIDSININRKHVLSTIVDNYVNKDNVQGFKTEVLDKYMVDDFRDYVLHSPKFLFETILHYNVHRDKVHKYTFTDEQVFRLEKYMETALEEGIKIHLIAHNYIRRLPYVPVQSFKTKDEIMPLCESVICSLMEQNVECVSFLMSNINSCTETIQNSIIEYLGKFDLSNYEYVEQCTVHKLNKKVLQMLLPVVRKEVIYFKLYLELLKNEEQMQRCINLGIVLNTYYEEGWLSKRSNSSFEHFGQNNFTNNFTSQQSNNQQSSFPFAVFIPFIDPIKYLDLWKFLYVKCKERDINITLYFTKDTHIVNLELFSIYSNIIFESKYLVSYNWTMFEKFVKLAVEYNCENKLFGLLDPLEFSVEYDKLVNQTNLNSNFNRTSFYFDYNTEKNIQRYEKYITEGNTYNEIRPSISDVQTLIELGLESDYDLEDIDPLTHKHQWINSYKKYVSWTTEINMAPYLVFGDKFVENMSRIEFYLHYFKCLDSGQFEEVVNNILSDNGVLNNILSDNSLSDNSKLLNLISSDYLELLVRAFPTRYKEIETYLFKFETNLDLIVNPPFRIIQIGQNTFISQTEEIKKISEDICSICQNEQIEKEVVLKCRHSFCFKCIEQLEYEKCPICKNNTRTIYLCK
jgi:hypothetical protein